MVSYKFEDFFCSMSVKNAAWILVGIALSLQIALGNVNISTMLILPTHEHRISFHVFVSSSRSLKKPLWFSGYRSFISLVKLNPRYFFVLAIVVFLISLPDFSLLGIETQQICGY